MKIIPIFAKNFTMETLFESFRIALELTPTDYIRSFHDKINWNNRLIGLLGQKGVGKSTLLLQHIRKFDNIEETLYVQADDFYFSGHRLFDLAYDFFKRGGRRLYIDEIHKYKGWSTEIKMIYDKLPLMSVVYSGSSLLALRKGGMADLSRRAIEYTMPGLSFREYLNISNGWNLKTATLEDILKGRVDFPYGEHRPLKYYEEYRKKGVYPFFAEDDFHLRLKQAINETVEHDIPNYAEIPVVSAGKLKKLMYVLANSVPFKPNYSKLSRDLEIGRNQIPDYVEYLTSSQLFNTLTEKGTGDAILQKVEKLYLNNSNIAFAVSDSVYGLIIKAGVELYIVADNLCVSVFALGCGMIDNSEGACAGDIEGHVVAGLVADPVSAVNNGLELYGVISLVNGEFLGEGAVFCLGHGVGFICGVPCGAEDIGR